MAATSQDLCASHMKEANTLDFVTTLGEASRLGWRVKAHCLQYGPMAQSGHGRRTNICKTVAELDLQTLIWTRGDAPRSTCWRAGLNVLDAAVGACR